MLHSDFLRETYGLLVKSFQCCSFITTIELCSLTLVTVHTHSLILSFRRTSKETKKIIYLLPNCFLLVEAKKQQMKPKTLLTKKAANRCLPNGHKL